MLNRNILILVIFFCVTSAHAQEYYVIQVKGTVKKNDSVILKPGQTVTSDDKLTFSSATDAVAVASAKRGRFIIQPNPAAKPGEFYSFVKDALIPGVKRLSTRHGEFNTVVDFQTNFKETHLMLPSLKYRINARNFPLSSAAFFFIRYSYKGEVINKKLAHSGDTIVVDRDELFSVDGSKITPHEALDLKLYYLSNGTSQHITPLQFDVTPPEQLKADADELAAVFKNETAKLKEELFLFLNEFYGKVDQRNFDRWCGNLGI